MILPWIFLVALLGVYSLVLPSLCKRAGMPSALAAIPLLNFFPLLKILKRPWWWFFLFLVPGVNLIMLVIVNVEIAIAFNLRSTADQWKFGVLPWYFLSDLAFKKKEIKYVGPRDWTGKKKSFTREWGEALVFAVVAASVIRTFLLEAFTIPTPSMEKSMLVGDYLFVSKIAYGPKIPQTPVSVPFIHNAMPGSMRNSYVEWFSLPYFRLPGLGHVERFDPVVFNFPNGDSIVVDPFFAGHDYYSILRREAMVGLYRQRIPADQIAPMMADNPEKYLAKARENFIKGICYSCSDDGRPKQIGGIKHRPMDKEENYVKRCIGLPGDNLKIVNRQVYINDSPIENPAGLQYNYEVMAKTSMAMSKIYRDFSVNLNDRSPDSSRVATIPLTIEEFDKLSKRDDIISIKVNNDTLGTAPAFALYPNSVQGQFGEWTQDNYGPIHIPAKGETIELTKDNIILYRRVIDVYENNDWSDRDGQVYINGSPATQYTFKQDYYWMMGDNRHQSADSRYWGFVPEDHIVGKPVFTWFSKSNPQYQEDTGIRWSRMFRFVK